MSWVIRASIGTSLLVLAGCLVGPDYERTALDLPPSYEVPRGMAAGPEEPRLDRWWDHFDDATLTSLIQRAEQGNLTLEQAAANVQVYRARYGISYSNLFPSINLGASYSRNRVNFASLGGAEGSSGPFNDWQYGLTLSTWEIDLWGKIRRGMQASQAELQGTVEQYRQALVSLRAETAIAYLTVRTLQAQLEYTREVVDLLTQVVRVTEAKFAAKTNTLIDVSQAKAQLANTKAQIPQLEAQIAEQSNGISVLLGEYPGPVARELAAPAPIPIPDRELAIGIPADLLRRRADVLDAERQLVAATARIGVAEAGFLPELTLVGNFGIDSSTFDGLDQWSNRVYMFGPRLSWNFFNGGRVVSQVKQAQALAMLSEIAWRQSVLNAVSQVQTSLSNYDGSRRAMFDYRAGVGDTKTAYDLALARYKAGTIDLTQLLQFAQVVLDAEIGLAQATGQTSQNLVELYRSLGGGWEAYPIPYGGADAFLDDRGRTSDGGRDEVPDGRHFPPQEPPKQSKEGAPVG
ncbi:MAG: TolC family protein, partial [Phycisphaerae bacterium]|nr:TolC family protein [Phycisphaerae bacterium]